jgi:putative glutamine amidotransferase
VVAPLVLLATLLAGAFGFRAWVHAAPADDAPVVGLSIGDDVLNDVGLHQAAYQAAITRLGGRAVEYSPSMGLTPEQVLDRIDALVLTGGGDVDPALYGQPGGPACLVDSERDAFEAALVRGAIDRDMPLLAVCRGHQLMNAALGGTVRDIRDEPRVARVHGITPRSWVAHQVRLTPGSQVMSCAGVERMTVNSFHGQVVDRLAPGLVATAVAPDGVVEAVEVPGSRFALGIQWHPELKPGDPGSLRVFERLLEAARDSRARCAPSQAGPPLPAGGR